MLAVTQGPRLWAALSRALRLQQALDEAAQAVDQAVGWDKLPTPLGLLTLVGVRHILRARNLADTTPAPPTTPPAPDARPLTQRTVDGTFNDLGCPVMGSAGMRFGRNVPREYTFPEDDAGILSPNPRTISRELLTRDTFQPATTLNILAAAWLQFQIRDWFSHGKNQKENPWQVPLADEDPWPEHPMRILRTAPDPTRGPADDGTPATHINTETHWWDASQIYGSTPDFQAKARTGTDGKLVIGRDHLVDIGPEALVQQAGLAGWWVGQSLMFTLFTLEHNAICDRLKAAYPEWPDDELFAHARLVNAALIAKIHTVEWTTAILGHPTMQIAMRVNWWGILGERIHNLLGRVSGS
ncbi:MAG: heme peroxidase, partial [Armatimonadetes bacterium]|nr:heme peroxidase [Armatimonadota bacterium]